MSFYSVGSIIITIDSSMSCERRVFLGKTTRNIGLGEGNVKGEELRTVGDRGKVKISN